MTMTTTKLTTMIAKAGALRAMALLCGMALLATSCTHDDDAPALGDDTVRIGASRTASLSWQTGTRAGEDDVESALPESIGVYADYSDDSGWHRVFDNQPMYYWPGVGYEGPNNLDVSTWPGDNHWVYAPTEEHKWKLHEYRFIAYAPYDLGVGAAEGSAPILTSGEITGFTRTNIPTVSAEDYTVAKQVLAYDNTTGRNGWNETHTAHAYPTVPMQHIGARLRLCFKLGVEYSRLRDIRIKEIKVTKAARLCRVTMDYSKTPPTMTLEALPGSNTTVTATLAPEKESTGTGGGMLLTTDYEPMGSLYVVPISGLGDQTLSDLQLEITYDVYDKAGTLARRNQVTRNTISLNLTTETGKYYDVKVAIEPDFLYILSDNEPDCDAWLELNPTTP